MIKHEDSLTAKYPELAKQWHPSKNEFSPEDVKPGSNKKVWWVCPLGHEYIAMIAKRSLRNQGCPYCANNKVLEGFNDMKTSHPEVLVFWDYDKNTIKPNEVLAGSEKKAWWKCDKGHSYLMKINAKTRGAGCPVCSSQVLTEDNCLATTEPRLAAEWHPTKNGKLTPHDVMRASHKMVWWKCDKGHEWQAQPYSRLIHGCPICDSEKRTSFPEQAILFYLSELFETQSRSDIGGFEADIFCPSINTAIEYDGEYYHTGKASDEREKRKTNILLNEELRFLE